VHGPVCRGTSMVVAKCVDLLASRDLSRVRGLGLLWFF